MQYSNSRIELFENCPFRYKMQYIDRMTTLPPDEANNALILGHALHTGIEQGVKAGINEYFMQYPIITDKHIDEAMKLEYLIPRVRELIPERSQFEVKIEAKDFIGYIDLLVKTKGDDYPMVDDEYAIYDFKYSNNINHYMDSPQLHLYKYFYEQTTGRRVTSLNYIFIPKVGIKQKQGETLYEFRRRIQSELNSKCIQIVPVDYDPQKVIEWLLSVKRIQEETEYEKNDESKLCYFCEFKDYCQKGYDYMLVPKKCTRRDISKISKRKFWIYGAPFSGKTTMLDSAPNPLNLNTDGNVTQVTMYAIPIKDEVKVEGRRSIRTFAWEVFKNVIGELEKKDNDFRTIIIDLVEDTREMCRVYMYDKLGIEHESDSGFGKGWDIVKTEYLSTMRKFFNLDYENLVIVSHEDISKDITKKNGQNITRIAPNIQEGVANKLAGMVDIVARVVVDDGTRTLNFKSDAVIFGGGRLKGVTTKQIPLSWDALMTVYDEVAANTAETASTETVTTDTTETEAPSETASEVPKKRRRKAADVEQADIPDPKPDAEDKVTDEVIEKVSTPPAADEPAEEQPKVRRRKRRDTDNE